MNTPVPIHPWLGISLESWLQLLVSALTIAAIILGPVFAVRIQTDKERREKVERERRDRRVGVLRRLMAYRGAKLSTPYVEALNSIELEFSDEKKIIEAWHQLVDHYNTPHGPEEASGRRWTETLDTVSADLLYEIAESLGYHFDKLTLRKGAYAPQGWIDEYNENVELRKASIKVFRGESKLKVEASVEQPPRG